MYNYIYVICFIYILLYIVEETLQTHLSSPSYKCVKIECLILVVTFLVKNNNIYLYIGEIPTRVIISFSCNDSYHKLVNLFEQILNWLIIKETYIQ